MDKMSQWGLPFAVEEFQLAGKPEEIIRGGREHFDKLHAAFEGVKQIGVIGWGSQGPAQAQNLRDSLASIGSQIKVVVGLRQNSDSISKANAAGFKAEDGTLGEMYEVIGQSDLVILLISDGAQTLEYPEVFRAIKPGATLGLSHGFLEGHLKNVGGTFPSDINVVMVAPKGMGPSVRRLYVQGKDTGGSGINSSVAVYQDVTGRAGCIAVAWAIAIGSPVVFQTTIPMEWRSDLFGERSILLGALWGMLEALFSMFLSRGQNEESAFRTSVLALTSFISPEISKLGPEGFFRVHIAGKYEPAFNLGFTTAYNPFRAVMTEIYENVTSGKEIQDVVLATQELAKTPMPSIETESMWQVGAKIREAGERVTEMSEEVAFVAGVYIAGIMAQFDVLRENGHLLSEVINESLIEATDSLTPYMDLKGVAYMVDNCSTTARLGTRRYGPVFKEALLESFLSEEEMLGSLADEWLEDPIHQAIEVCYELKPTVAIVVAV